jgi:WhiB family transcriptional regulator, redox-sensing transcriptional regulator
MSTRRLPVTGPDVRARQSPPAAHPYGDEAAARAFILDGIGTANRAPRLGLRLGPRSSPARSTHGAFELPCRRHDPAMWFADDPADLERAKALCAGCPIRLACLAVAIHRAEYTGVWGGHILDRGTIVPHKRPRGRPRKHNRDRVAAGTPDASIQEHHMIATVTPVTSTGNQDRLDIAAARLYEAECALHAAHQSHAEGWITAASQKLHQAVTAYLRAAGAGPIQTPSLAAISATAMPMRTHRSMVTT